MGEPSAVMGSQLLVGSDTPRPVGILPGTHRINWVGVSSLGAELGGNPISGRGPVLGDPEAAF